MRLLWWEQERNQVRHLLDSDGVFHAFGQGIIAGVVAVRAFVAHRLARACHAIAKRRRVNLAFDDEAGVGQTGFQFGQNVFKAANLAKQIKIRETRIFARLEGLIEPGYKQCSYEIRYHR